MTNMYPVALTTTQFLPTVVKKGNNLPSVIKNTTTDIVEFSAKGSNLKKAGKIGIIAAGVAAVAGLISSAFGNKESKNEIKN